MSSPLLPDRPGSVWSRFPLDPRTSGDLRAADGDRELTREILAEAYTDGRLDRDDYNERLDQALSAQHLGQLVPILNDVAVPRPGTPGAQSGTPAPQTRGTPGLLSHGPVRATLFVVGITNLIWIATSVSSGHLQYYWPIWPALGMAITLLATVLFGRDQPKKPDGA